MMSIPPSLRMLRHIRDVYTLSAGKLELKLASTQADNRENYPKVANVACVLRIYGRPTFVSQ